MKISKLKALTELLSVLNNFETKCFDVLLKIKTFHQIKDFVCVLEKIKKLFFFYLLKFRFNLLKYSFLILTLKIKKNICYIRVLKCKSVTGK